MPPVPPRSHWQVQMIVYVLGPIYALRFVTLPIITKMLGISGGETFLQNLKIQEVPGGNIWNFFIILQNDRVFQQPARWVD